ncbi:MAG: FkbM family methyltransferase, partial [Planctomycetes bacterium]|nr:FkbM family methyltransferase [Planctomycetota bacterium]
FLGRYHDLPIQLALQQVLRPGDAFVDVGANLGLVAMLASRLVGPSGRVVACEPNPAVLERLRAALQHNGIGNVEVVAAALGEAPGAAELRVYGGHSGWGSLAAEGPPELTAAATHRVELRTGDAVLGPLPPAQPLVIKIDVEGHELPVLRGLRRTLAARLPLVFLEVADVHQRRAGHSAAALLGELERYGYVGYGLTSRRTLGGHRLGLESVAGRSGGEFDAVFVPDRGPLRERLAALLP